MNSEKIRSAFGDRVKQLRAQKDVSQDELAKKAGVNRSYLSLIENGKSSPTLDVAERLAQGLGISTLELLSADDKKHFTYDEEVGFEIYPALKEFLEDEDLMLMMNPTAEEIIWLRGSRFNNFKPTKKFFQELLLANRKSRK